MSVAPDEGLEFGDLKTTSTYDPRACPQELLTTQPKGFNPGNSYDRRVALKGRSLRYHPEGPCKDTNPSALAWL